MASEQFRYSGDSEVTVEKLKKWLLSKLPNYVTSLKTVAEAKEFASEKAIHKVFLFTDKKKTPPIFQALATEWNNKLRFAVVN